MVCDPPMCMPPPPGCSVHGAVMDAANCKFSCGTVVCDGDASTTAPAPTTATATDHFGTQPLLGGFAPVKDLADAPLVHGTTCALALLDAASNSLYTHALVAIVSARRQVVNGFNYNVVVDLATTTCRFGVAAVAGAACPIVAGTTTRWEMQFYVGLSGMCANMAAGPAFFQYDADTTAVPAMTSAPGGSGGGVMVGGYSTIADLADDHVVAAAKCAVGLIDAASRSLYRHALVAVVSGQRQVVAGLNYKLVLAIAPTACRTTAPADAACPAVDGAVATQWSIQFFVGFDGVCVNPAGGPVISIGDNNNGGSVDPPLDNGAAASSSSNAAASIGIPVGVVAGCLLIVLVVLVVARSRSAGKGRVVNIQPRADDVLANPTYEANPFLSHA